jgi:transposase
VAGRRFKVADVVEVLQHWQAGNGTRELSRRLGMGRPRLRRILRSAWAAGVRPGEGPALSEEEWRQRCPALFRSPHRGREPEQRQGLAAFREAIDGGLATNTVTTVWERLRDEQGLGVSLSTFRRYVRDEIRQVVPGDVTVRREQPVAGEVAEVDYGRMGIWDDPITGKRRVVQAFVMTLCFSRRTFVMPVFSCDQEAWTRCHVAAFAFFGGAPLTSLDLV